MNRLRLQFAVLDKQAEVLTGVIQESQNPTEYRAAW
jgi:hypothetical protein